MSTVGFGTGRLSEEDSFEAIRNAIKAGYRFFDTAPIYGTESVLGSAIEVTSVDRSDLFIGTKVESKQLSRDAIAESVEESLKALNTEYIDLLYVHWPSHEYDPERTFKSFEKIQDAGLIHSVGICNVTIDILDEAVKHSPTPIDYVQIEFHPYLYQQELLSVAKRYDAKVVAESPFARGRVLDDPVVKQIAKKKEVSPAVLVLTWSLAHETIPIPSSANPEHIHENLLSTKISLSQNEVQRLNELDADERVNSYKFAPWNS